MNIKDFLEVILMLKIIKNGLLYNPEYRGQKDIMLFNDKIVKIADCVNVPDKDFYQAEVIDATDQYIVPGFIDLHVHIAGGGGEGGYKTRTPEIKFSDIIASGVTTLVGLLGTDGVTRSLQNLLTKARALEEEGISTFIWTGCYEYPTRTITKSAREDIMLIDKIIGVGEVAISDHRGSHPVKKDIEGLVLESRVGGMLSGKCGVLHLHVGDDKEGIKDLLDMADTSNILLSNLLPTHMNRNMHLLYQGKNYIKKGGFIDLTSGIYKTKEDPISIDASYSYNYLIENGCNPSHITVSSDSNGSMPLFNNLGELTGLAVGKINTNLIEFRKMIQVYNLPLSTSLLPFTSNPSTILHLKNKGFIEEGRDGDILILNKDLSLDYVIGKGNTLVQHGHVVKFGYFEQGDVQ